MLEKIKLTNFKSFGNLEADFTSSLNKSKKLIMIYGENGSGKSNFVSSILFLKNTFNTFSLQEYLNKIIQNDVINEYDEELIKNIIRNKKVNLFDEIKNYKMIESNGTMSLEFTFTYNDNSSKEAIYKMEFDNQQIIFESFYCQLEKNLVLAFEITNNEIHLNNSLFINKNYEKEIKDKIYKFFGKHSFLSILFNEIKQNNLKFINDSISNSFLKAIEELDNCSVWYKNIDHVEMPTNHNHILYHLSNGMIEKKELNKLKELEEALNNYFTSLYSDIKGVHYELNEENNKISYTLYFDKIINQNIRSIPYSMESTGTMKLLTLFLYINRCIVSNETVFIDEIDSGIHDILMNYLLLNLEKEIKGQLIITTHNTLLLQKINPEYSYVINVDINGNKSLNCIKDFGRIQKNHNITTRYLNGVFGGIPQPGYLDLQEIMSSINMGSDQH